MYICETQLGQARYSSTPGGAQAWEQQRQMTQDRKWGSHKSVVYYNLRTSNPPDKRALGLASDCILEALLTSRARPWGV